MSNQIELNFDDNQLLDTTKFGFITDTHYDYKYESRKDNTLDTLINKTEQCYKWFKEQGCSYVIHGGDMFDRHRIYNFDLIKKVRRVLRESGLVTYFIMGQHDLQGYNLDTLPASNLGFIEDISDGSLVLIKDELKLGDYYFIASHVNMDSIELIKSVKKHDKPVICVCHALLTDKREAFGTISIKHYKNPNVQLILSGDLHDGVSFQSCNNIQFYNPGALARTEKGMRMPKVGTLQWDGNKFIIEEFTPNCPKCEDIFFWDDDKIKTASVNEERIEENKKDFIESFKEFHSSSKNIYELLIKIGEANNINPDVIDLIKQKKDLKVN